MAGFFKKIMIIDDDKVDRMSLKKILGKHELAEEIIEADTGMQALDVLTAVGMQHQQFPELIFLDVNMPAMTGFQFLDVFNQLSYGYIRRCRIVMLSSVEDKTDREHALKYENVSGFFIKPLTNETVEALKSQLRHTNAS